MMAITQASGRKGPRLAHRGCKCAQVNLGTCGQRSRGTTEGEWSSPARAQGQVRSGPPRLGFCLEGPWAKVGVACRALLLKAEKPAQTHH